ncbi:MAG: MATE family efflux transporter [Acidobacteriaceae bacterium]
MPSITRSSNRPTGYARVLSAPLDLISGLLGGQFQGTDSSEAEGIRSAERSQRATLTGLTSILAKVVVLLTTIISVPLTFRYLGDDRYGLWMTITSCVLFLGFADLGMGNGLAAAISYADGKDDTAYARRQVSCAFFLLLMIGMVLLALIFLLLPVMPWSRFYGLKSAIAAHEAGPATAVLVACAALSMPLGTVLRVQLGYQEGYVGDLWNAGGNLLALLGIITATRLHCSLPVLVLAVAGAPLVTTSINWIVQFYWVRPWLRPSIRLFDRRTAMDLARVGFLFFLQQCFGLIYYVSDNLVIARELGSPKVAEYAVLQKIFSIGLIAQYFMVPLWPAIGEALSRSDFRWAQHIVRRAILFSLILGSVCALLLLGSSRFLMRHWSGVDPGPVDALRIGFAVWVVLVGYVAATNAILNQPHIIKHHLVIFGGAALLSLGLKIWLARLWSLPGIIWGTILGYSIIYVGPAAWLAFSSVVAPPTTGAAERSCSDIAIVGEIRRVETS